MGTFVAVIAVVLTLACLLLSGSRCFSQTPSSPPAGTPSSPPAATAAEKMKSLDRVAIRALLKRLADTPAPREISPGAMCYVSGRPTRIDYVCPKCGDRTVYEDSKAGRKEKLENESARFVAANIASCRREFERLQKVAGDTVKFDESQFCRKCSPGTTDPKLVLHITYRGDKTRDVENITHKDLRILREFLAGELLANGDNDSKLPLKDHLPRLQELLGVKLDE